MALKRYIELTRKHQQRQSSALSNESDGLDPFAGAPRWLAAARAYLLLARQDTAEALAQFASLPDSTGIVWLERLTLARLLAARG